MFCGSKTLITLGTAFFIMAVPFTSMAASSTINDVSIDIVSAGGTADGDGNLDVVVTTDSDMYHLDKAYDIDEPDGDFKEIDRPTLVVRINADGNYTFSSRAVKNIKINGAKGTVIGGLMNETNIKVYIVFDALYDNGSNHSLNVIDLNVNELKWDKTNGLVRWDAVSEADNYQLRLYRGSGLISSFITKDPNYDLSAYITKEGKYSYQVRAVTDSSLKGTWNKSDVFQVTSEDASRISFGKSKKGLEGPGSRWQFKNDKWYFMNESGTMVTGWINWKSKWYYCGNDGAMYTNTTTPDGYKVGSDGAWVE